MGKKNKRKDNKKHLRPPLTFLDKSIYLSCIILSFFVCLVLVFCFDNIRNAIAFDVPYVIAYTEHASYLFTVPFILFLETSSLVLFIAGWESKKPIFGSKKYKYGEYPFREDCFPLFSSQKRNQHKTPSRKKFVRQMTILWCSFLIIFSCFIPFGLFGRNVIYQDHHIETVNCINKLSNTYTVNDFSELTIRSRYVSGYRVADYWEYEITIGMKDGKSFSFSNGDFDWRIPDTKDVCLDKMLEIKGLFDSDNITIKGADDIDEVSDYFEFNEQQRKKLQLLFS